MGLEVGVLCHNNFLYKPDLGRSVLFGFFERKPSILGSCHQAHALISSTKTVTYCLLSWSIHWNGFLKWYHLSSITISDIGQFLMQKRTRLKKTCNFLQPRICAHVLSVIWIHNWRYYKIGHLPIKNLTKLEKKKSSFLDMSISHQNWPHVNV